MKEKIEAFAKEWALDPAKVALFIRDYQTHPREAICELWDSADYLRWKKEKLSTKKKYEYIDQIMKAIEVFGVGGADYGI